MKKNHDRLVSNKCPPSADIRDIPFGEIVGRLQ